MGEAGDKGKGQGARARGEGGALYKIKSDGELGVLSKLRSSLYRKLNRS